MKKEFLRQMEIEYERRNSAADSMARKIRDLMTVSAIMIAAITAFYGHMWSVVDEKGPLFHLPVISVGMLGAATVLCVVANRAEVEMTVFLGSKMTKGSKIKKDMVDSWTGASEDDFYESLIEEYLLCLKEAEITVRKKAISLTACIMLFCVGSISFPLFVVISMALA